MKPHSRKRPIFDLSERWRILCNVSPLPFEVSTPFYPQIERRSRKTFHAVVTVENASEKSGLLGEIFWVAIIDPLSSVGLYATRKSPKNCLGSVCGSSALRTNRS
jgi:hypothetical protein